MAGYHQTIIVGRVGNRDDTIRYTASGTAVFGFSVAVNERWNDRQSNERREKTTWYRVTLWRRLAESLQQYIQVGTEIMVVGTVEARAYTNNAGEAAASLDLTARDIQLLGGRGDGQGQGGQGYQGQQGQGGGFDDFAPPPDDVNDIPF